MDSQFVEYGTRIKHLVYRIFFCTSHLQNIETHVCDSLSGWFQTDFAQNPQCSGQLFGLWFILARLIYLNPQTLVSGWSSVSRSRHFISVLISMHLLDSWSLAQVCLDHFVSSVINTHYSKTSQEQHSSIYINIRGRVDKQNRGAIRIRVNNSSWQKYPTHSMCGIRSSNGQCDIALLDVQKSTWMHFHASVRFFWIPIWYFPFGWIKPIKPIVLGIDRWPQDSLTWSQ